MMGCTWGQVVTAWNGLAIGAFANASRILASEAQPPAALFPVEGRPAHEYLNGDKPLLISLPDGLPWHSSACRKPLT